MFADQHITGLEIPVNNSLLMRMLNGTANANQQLDATLQRKSLLIAKLRDRFAFDQLHGEVR